MLDMGFLPSMKQIVFELGMPEKSERQTLMFSATFPEEVQRLAREMLNDYIFVTIGHVGGANVDIEQQVLNIDDMNKRDHLVRILNEQGLLIAVWRNGKGIGRINIVTLYQAQLVLA